MYNFKRRLNSQVWRLIFLIPILGRQGQDDLLSLRPGWPELLTQRVLSYPG